MKFLTSLILVTFLSACQSGQKTHEAPMTIAAPTNIEEAIGSNYRTPENLQRDIYRHPLETLNFFGLKPEMTVIEISPSAGWYMEILAPYLSTKGQYIAALPATGGNEYLTKLNDKTKNWLNIHPELQAKVKLIEFAPQKDLAIEQPVDMILTFRNVHNWAANRTDQAAFNVFFKALKKGGILGVIDHRANPKSKRDPKAKSGYMREADIIKMAKHAGFKLVAKSEINANPKDLKNYPDGVWTLPPTLRLKDKDRGKYFRATCSNIFFEPIAKA